LGVSPDPFVKTQQLDVRLFASGNQRAGEVDCVQGADRLHRERVSGPLQGFARRRQPGPGFRAPGQLGPEISNLGLLEATESKPGRSRVQIAQAIDFADVMLTREYNGGRAYRQSKLAQILFTVDLAAALKGSGVTVTCLHPSTFMDTTMVRQAGTTPLSTVDDGADAILNLAVGPEMEGRSGLYFNVLQEAQANAQAYDAAARAKLRELSVRLTGVSAAT